MTRKEQIKQAIILREDKEWNPHNFFSGKMVKIVNLKVRKNYAIYDLIFMDTIRGYAERHNKIKTDLK